MASSSSQWYFDVNKDDSKLYLFRNGRRLMGEGTSDYVNCLINVRKFSRNGVDYLVFKTLQELPKPRALRLDSLFWQHNKLTRLFQEAASLTSADLFCRTWRTRIHPFLSPDGVFQPSEGTQQSDLTSNQGISGSCTPQGAQQSDYAPGKGSLQFFHPQGAQQSNITSSQGISESFTPQATQQSNCTHSQGTLQSFHPQDCTGAQQSKLALNPAISESFAPREKTSGGNGSRKRKATSGKQPVGQKKHCSEDLSEKSITNLDSNFLGQFLVPVNCLVEPSKLHLIRPPDRNFLQSLKNEMLTNPVKAVAPFLVLVQLEEGQQFDAHHTEAYRYETIGGNHSRIALQEILEEHPELVPNYSRRLASVYQGLTNEQVQHLAHRHNRATEFMNKMTTQDKVSSCRMTLYTMARVDCDEETPPKTAEWKEACSSALMANKKQLDEGMVFFLASLPVRSYAILKDIYASYEEGSLIKLPKSKTGVNTGRVDCKGSLFRGLRNLDNEVVYGVLEKVKCREILITALNNECRKMKKMVVLKKAFCKGVGVESWDEAVEAFPSFATTEGVAKFIHVEPESAQFQQYCMKAARMKAGHTLPLTGDTASKTQGDLVVLGSDLQSLNYNELSDSLPNFVGFELIIGKGIQWNQPNVQLQTITRSVQRLNTAAGKLGHTILLLVPVDKISSALSCIEELDYRAQVLYWKTNTCETGNLFTRTVQPVLAATLRGGLDQHEDTLTDYFQGDEEELIAHLLDHLSAQQDCVLAINCKLSLFKPQMDRKIVILEDVRLE